MRPVITLAAALCASACSSGDEHAARITDITNEVGSAVDRTGSYEVRAKTDVAVSCLCVFSSENEPYQGASLNRAAIAAKYAACSNRDRNSAYAPGEVAGDGMFVLIGRRGNLPDAEIQSFRHSRAVSSALGTHAPGCFKARGAILRPGPRGFRLIGSIELQEPPLP